MLRVLILSIVMAGNFGAQSPRDDYGEKLLEFHYVYDEYFRKYFGCPEEAKDPKECKPDLGVRDYRLEMKVVDKARMFLK